MTKEKLEDVYGLIETKRQYHNTDLHRSTTKQQHNLSLTEHSARIRMNKPRGEKALHYASVICIRSRYPHTTIAPTLWKHQHAHYARLDTYRI